MSNDISPVSQPQNSSSQPEDIKAPPKLKSAMKKVSQFNENDRQTPLSPVKGTLSVGSSQSKTKTNVQGNKILSKEEKKAINAERVKTANAELEQEKIQDADKQKTQKITFNDEKNVTHEIKSLKNYNKNISKKENEENEFKYLLHSGRSDMSEDGNWNIRAPLRSKNEVEKLLSNKGANAFLIYENDKGEKVFALNKKENDRIVVKYIKFEVTEEGKIKEESGKLHPSFLKFLTANDTNKSKGIKEEIANTESNEAAEKSEVKTPSLKDRSISFLNKILSGGKSFGSGLYGLGLKIKEAVAKIFEDKSLQETANKVYNRKTMGVNLSVVDQTHQADTRAREIEDVLRKLGIY